MTIPLWWQNGVIYQIYPKKVFRTRPAAAPAIYAASRSALTIYSDSAWTPSAHAVLYLAAGG